MTTIQDTVYNAAGVPANGQIVIDSPPFTLNGVSVAASQITTPIVDGVLNVQLFPNMNAQPTGVYYTARYELDQGPVFEEYWVVPNLPTVNLGQVRVTFPATPSVMINAQQLTSAGALPGQFLGWNGGNWVPMYVTSFNYYPNFINLYLTGFPGPDLSVGGSPASLGGGFSLNVPDAGPTSRGVVTTGAQTFSGNKTFSNNVAITGSLTGPNAVFTDLTVTGSLLATGQSNLLLDPTTTLGDLIVRGQNPPPTRFAAGSNGTVLTSDSTQPLGLRWGPAPAPDPTMQTGDLLVRGPGTIQRLGVGSNGQVLTADSSQPLGMAWEAAAGGVPETRMIATGLGLTGGGNLSQDLTLSVVPDTTNQQVMAFLNGAGPISTRHAINYIEGANVTLVIGDDPTNNRTNVTIASTGGPLPPGSVTSVFGRNGDVLAMSGDYTAAQVTNAVSVLGSYPNPVWITSLDYGKLINVPTQFPPAPHTHDASAIVTGIIAPARLGTGTANNGVFLRGDSVWAVTTGQPQTPWAQTIVGAGFQLQNAGWIGVGTSTIPIQSPIAGRAYITIRGTTDAGVIELATGSADADQTLVGRVAYTDIANTQADKRSAFIDAYRSGAVAGNRGSLLAFWTRSDGGSTPSERMVLSNQGRLGVGTLTPAYAIDVVGDVNVSGCYRMGSSAFACPDSGGGGGIDLSNIVTINGSTPSGFWQPGSDGAIYYNGGNVGIGTTSPTSLLTVRSSSSGAGTASQVMALNSAGSGISLLAYAPGNTYINMGATFNGTSWVALDTAAMAFQQTASGLTIYGAAGLTVGGSANMSPYVTVLAANGNVGIGTTTPSAILHVAADAYRQLYLTGLSVPTSQLRMGFDVSNNTCVIEGVMAGNFDRSLLLNPSGGNVGIRTTAPAYALDVNGSIQISAAQNLIFNPAADSGVHFFGTATAITRRASDGSLLVTAGQGSLFLTAASAVVSGSGSNAVGWSQGQFMVVSGRSYFYGGNEPYAIGLAHAPSDTGGIYIGCSSNTGFFQVSNSGGGAIFLIDQTGNANLPNGFLNIGSGNASTPGDLCVARNASPGTGVVYFGNTGAHYLYWDGGNFNFTGGVNISGAGIMVGGNCNLVAGGQYEINGVPISTGGVTNFSAPSRAMNTVYQNTTGKPMFVTVSAQSSSGFGLQCKCDGGNPPGTIVGDSSIGGSGLTMYGAISFWVLPGWYYEASGAGPLVRWSEWW